MNATQEAQVTNNSRGRTITPIVPDACFSASKSSLFGGQELSRLNVSSGKNSLRLWRITLAGKGKLQWALTRANRRTVQSERRKNIRVDKPAETGKRVGRTCPHLPRCFSVGTSSNMSGMRTSEVHGRRKGWTSRVRRLVQALRDRSLSPQGGAFRGHSWLARAKSPRLLVGTLRQ